MKPHRTSTTLLLIAFLAGCLVMTACGGGGGGGSPVTKQVWYADRDRDGFGDPEVSQEVEEQPDGYVGNAFDCDDGQAMKNPGQREIVDQLDNDCDGDTDEPAEPGFIPDTGQIESFTNTFGEDSDYLIDPPSYTKLDENGRDLPDAAAAWVMVRDNVTGLIWEAKDASDGYENKENPHDPDNAYTFEAAGNDFITRLNNEDFGHFTDGEPWRLPTIHELLLICTSDRISPAVNTDYFPHAAASSVWSATVNIEETSEAWMVNPIFGSIISQGMSVTSQVRAVRFHTEDGVRTAPGDPALEAYGGGIVKDSLNKLMWIKNPITGDDDKGYTWVEALDYCENLEYGGFRDWRLPSKNELATLLRFNLEGAGLDTDQLSDKVDVLFWTSTAFPSDTNRKYAWYIHFEDQFVFFGETSKPGWIRPVRGGNNITTKTWYRDGDGDGYGDESVFTVLDATVAKPEGYVADSSDCNDDDALFNPVAEDTPDDSIDQDCTGLDAVTWYRDADGDLYGDEAVFVIAESRPDGYLHNQEHIDAERYDCADDNVSVYPGALEITDDGLDNDCNGKQSVSWYADGDGDGYGSGQRVAVGEDPPEAGLYAENDLDCNDADGDTHPGLVEIEGDVLDTNCNGDVDDENVSRVPDTGQTTSYTDTWGEDADVLIHAPGYTRIDSIGEDTDDGAESWDAVRDNVTGLVWEVKTGDNADTTYSFIGAGAYAETLNLGGFDDWRLPTLAELATLAHMDRENPAINSDYFPHTQAYRYWTSTRDGSDTQALTVSFRYGESSRQNTTALLRVRAVRGGNTLATGLADNGDGTVTDVFSGLMWSDVELSNGSWADSIDFWDQAEHAGYTDWRLPSDADMGALFDLMDEHPDLVLSDIFLQPVTGNFWMLSRDEALAGFAKVYSLTPIGTDVVAETVFIDGRGVRGTRLGRFMDPGDGTVYDRKTGLMWAKAQGNGGIPITFDGALTGADSMGTEGYTDWRVPNRNELIALLNAQIDDAKAFETAFPDTAGLYWTSTSSSALSGYAWQIRFTRGNLEIALGHVTNENAFRAVRGGN